MLQIPSTEPDCINFVRVFALSRTVKPVAVTIVGGDEGGQNSINVFEIGTIENGGVRKGVKTVEHINGLSTDDR